MSRQAYPQYKPSAVSWLGDIPEHWEVRPLKYSADLINTKIDGAAVDLPYTGLEHIESWTGKRISPDGDITSEGQANLYGRGDVLFGKLRPYLAKAHAAEIDGICTGELLVLRPQAVKQKFLLNYVLNPDFVAIVDSSTYGAKMPRANWEFIGNLPALIPPMDEQQTIAAFLDRETARIDALIKKKQRQIELLQEKRTALISHAVTKGLDPNVQTKDSGIEWLGEIPAHWSMLQLRRVVDKFVDYRGKTPAKTDSGIPLITAGAVKDGHIDHSLVPEFIADDDYEDWMSRGKPEQGDVVITTEAPLGEVAQVSDSNVAFAQRIILFKVNNAKMISEFLRYYYLSVNGRSELLSRASGSTASGIRADRLKMSIVNVPPFNEQHEIVEYLEDALKTLMSPRTLINESISKLREYRTALISAAVTGKIDVRKEA